MSRINREEIRDLRHQKKGASKAERKEIKAEIKSLKKGKKGGKCGGGSDGGNEGGCANGSCGAGKTAQNYNQMAFRSPCGPQGCGR